PARRAVLYEELGPQADQVHFATFDTTPIAAASIGQVYRATLPGGHPVAVKLQYPGIREAIQSDLANVEGLLSAASVVLPRMHVEQGLADITARIEEECDYTQERAHYERFAQIWTDDPVVRIPATHPQLCTTRALVTDFIDGQTWEEAVPNMHQEGRNHVGQTLFRFVFQTLYGHGLFNADPHPGNVLFLPGGSIAFLDFGCVQSYTPETRDAIREIRDAIVEQADEATVKTLTQRAFQVPDVFDDDMWALLVRTMRLCFEPLAAPQPFRFTRDYTAGITQMVMDAKMVAARRLLSTGIQEPKMEGFVFLTRIIFGLSSLLARLEAQADWLELTYQCEAKHAHR
ncbi:MAG: AarF/ABC1/UbiB kinase family protein, partial [Myxococcota bacterium]